ncbi:hypothetical protein [Burkholderia multivorans]|uniref:hypothetical protein n=1 Tax=Burkholderia multivorans TaxID=87883 RepID=UPI0021BEDC5B|nr:hypothetical protein [Burkholderia multivorans]
MNAPDGPADDGALRLMCARCRWDALCGARAVQIKTSGGFSMHDDAAASRKPQAASRKPQAASRKPQAASRKQASGKQASRQAGKQAPKGVAIRRLPSRTRRTGTRVPRAFLAPSGDVGGGA